MNQVDVGARIAARMKARNWTQEELAQRAGIERTHLSRLLRGSAAGSSCSWSTWRPRYAAYGLVGWVGFFGVCTVGVERMLGALDAHIRRRLRALQLKHWKRKPTNRSRSERSRRRALLLRSHKIGLENMGMALAP